ncbi:MAG: hypothetical protein IPO06_22695 [Leptospiraceae bacterium]|nr:hypothetical protein [Leptospiraceae bacterium]
MDISKKSSNSIPSGAESLYYLKVFDPLIAVSDVVYLNSDIDVTGKTVYLSGYVDTNNNGQWELSERSFGKIMNPIVISNYYQTGYNPEWTDRLQISFCNTASASVKCSVNFDSNYCNENNNKSCIGEITVQSGLAEIYIPKDFPIYGSCNFKYNEEKYYAPLKSEEVSTLEACNRNIITVNLQPISKNDFSSGIYISWWERKWGEADNQKIKQRCIDNTKIVSYSIIPSVCKSGTTTFCQAFESDSDPTKLGKLLQKSLATTYPITMYLRENSKVKGTCFVDANFYSSMRRDYYDDCGAPNTEPSFYWKSHSNGSIPDEVDITEGGSLSSGFSWYDPYSFCN